MQEIAGDDNNKLKVQGKPNNQGLRKVQCGSKEFHDGFVPREKGEVKEPCGHILEQWTRLTKQCSRAAYDVSRYEHQGSSQRINYAMVPLFWALW